MGFRVLSTYRHGFEKFNDEDQADLGTPFAIEAQSALNDIAAVFPRQSVHHDHRTEGASSPTQQLADFYFVLDVVNDPMRVFSLMSVGGLLPRQRDAVKLVFPGISAAISDAIEEALVEATAKRSTDPQKLGNGVRVSPVVTFGIQTWRGQRTAEFRPPQNTPQPGGPPPKQRGGKAGGKKEPASDKATQSQKLDAGV